MAARATVDINYSSKTLKTSTVKSDKTSYTVQSGDTLWSIAKRFLGDGVRWREIYDLNKTIIEKTAKNRGLESSDNGHWIFRGTVLQIPVETKVTKTEKIVTDDINAKIESFSYTDVASGKSDSITLSIEDISKEWMGNRMPQKGFTLDASINTEEWGSGVESFFCGTFVMDDISFAGRPLNCCLNAVSVPMNDDFKTKQNTVTWQDTTLYEVAKKIAEAAQVGIYYSGSTVKISDIEQSKQTDSAFLYDLCEKYGFSIKVYNKKIVIFETEKAEAKASVKTFDESELVTWSHNSTIDGTYTGIELSYTDPSNDKTYTVNVGTKGRTYFVNTQASSEYDAELKAKALLNKANREVETMTITIRADNSIVAGQSITITGLGNLGGKYYIDQIKHNVGNGYTMNLTLHKVQVPEEKKLPTDKKSGAAGDVKASQNGQTITYTVVHGDNLWSIAKRFLGDGSRWREIYNLNKETIDHEELIRGLDPNDNYYTIFSGTVLRIKED